MKLQTRLMDDLKEAMRAKDAPRKDAIRMIRAAIKNAEIDMKREASDDEVLEIISREVKRRREALEMFRNAGRDDLVAEEQLGLATLVPYLPEQLSREDIAQVIEQIVSEIGAGGMAQMGAVMRQAMSQLKGKADGKVVNQVTREILSR